MNTDMREAVLAIVARIPPGRVVSYGQLAALAGRPRAARLVGWILRRSGSDGDLPCHRVVRADGTIPEEAFGVQGLQRELLRAEGTPFTPQGHVDMQRARWDALPPEKTRTKKTESR